MCCWGNMDATQRSTVDFTIGVSCTSLAPLGLMELPDDYVFTIPVRGSPQQPSIDLVGCADHANAHIYKAVDDINLPFSSTG